MRNYRKVLIFLLHGATLLFGIAWIINFGSTLQQLAGVNLGIQKFEEILFFHKLPLLASYIIKVDLSTVTTFLLLITIFKVNLGIWRLVSPEVEISKLPKKKIEHFPFWSEYKTTFVQLGLIGTLFAFIIAFGQAEVFMDPNIASEIQATENPVGYSQGESGSASLSASTVLLTALGTALWSTFSAILLAFIICPIIEIPFRKTIERTNNKAATENRNLEDDLKKISSGFNTLRTQISNTNSAFSGLIERIDKLGGVDELSKFIDETREQLSGLKSDVERLEKEKEEIEHEHLTLKESHNKLQLDHNTLKSKYESHEIDNLVKVVNELKIKLPDIKKELSLLRSKAEDFEKMKNAILNLNSLFASAAESDGK